jgi:predicted MPP superfamily phosphohydrolase
MVGDVERPEPPRKPGRVSQAFAVSTTAVRDAWQRAAHLFTRITPVVTVLRNGCAAIFVRLRRPAIVLGVAALATGGAWVGMVALGQSAHTVGPVETTMRFEPSWQGESVVSLPPLGTLELDTHVGPIRLHVNVDGVNQEAAKRLVERGATLATLQEVILEDVRTGMYAAAARAVLAGMVGAVAVTLLVTRRFLPTLVAAGGSAIGLLAVFGLAGATLDPRAVTEPKYTGLLTEAPALVGNARDVAENFNAYSDELVRLVTNVTQLYDVTSTLPAYEPQEETIRLLHISDLHLGEHAWDIIRSIVRQYSIDLIVDSGDTTDHGLPAENYYFTRPIRDLRIPYVWVRGNHDSLVTERAMRRIPNVVVLDGKVKTVKGIRFLGAGDPRFTPAWRRVVPDSDAEAVAEQAMALARVAEAAKDPVDAIVFHDSTGAAFFDGHAPLLLTGHGHEQLTAVLPKGSRLMQEGTTGGAGMRALKYDEPQPVQLSVLYLDPHTQELQAWDSITLGGLGLTSARIERHQVTPAEEPTSPPSPVPTPSGPVPTTPLTTPTVTRIPSPMPTPPLPTSESPTSPTSAAGAE